MSTNYKPPFRWQVLQTTGLPLMKKRATQAATVNNDSVTFTVPQGERWHIFAAQIQCCTLSSGNLTCYLGVFDANNSLLYYLILSSLSSGSYAVFPNGTAAVDTLNIPIPLYEGQTLKFFWYASANKSGTLGFYLNVLKFNVGKGD